MEENKKRFKYVRTKDGVLTVEDFVLSSLEKEFERLGKVVRNFEKTERLVDKYSTRNFYEFDLYVPISAGSSFLEKTEHCIMPEYDALKDVEETPNRKADAIEELCDCYLEDYGEGVPAIITKDMFANPKNSIWVDLIKGKVLRKEITFYACIVDRNSESTHIRSIAKMNGKGEFELL